MLTHYLPQIKVERLHLLYVFLAPSLSFIFQIYSGGLSGQNYENCITKTFLDLALCTILLQCISG